MLLNFLTLKLTNTQFLQQDKLTLKNNRAFSLWFLFVKVLMKHGSNICFFCLNAERHANKRTKKDVEGTL